MKRENIVPRMGIEPASLGSWVSVLPITPHRFPDVAILPTSILGDVDSYCCNTDAPNNTTFSPFRLKLTEHIYIFTESILNNTKGQVDACWSLTSLQHLISYQEWYQLVSVRTRGTFIMVLQSDQATSTMCWYPTESHDPPPLAIRSLPLVASLPSARLGRHKCQFCKSLAWDVRILIYYELSKMVKSFV